VNVREHIELLIFGRVWKKHNSLYIRVSTIQYYECGIKVTYFVETCEDNIHVPADFWKEVFQRFGVSQW